MKNDSDLIAEDQKGVVKGEKLFESQQLVGTFVASERTATHHGRITQSQGVALNPGCQICHNVDIQNDLAFNW